MAGDSLAMGPRDNPVRCARLFLPTGKRSRLFRWAFALAGALALGFLAAAPTSLAEGLGASECSDTIDNDMDGFIDLADPSCLGNPLNNAEMLGTQCDDNVDNEPDGQTDLADAGCLADLLRDDETGELVVNSTLDKVDTNPGDGLCETEIMSECTVRAAIMEANETLGEQGVQVPAGMFELTIAPIGLSLNTGDGDLDIADDLVLIGAGAKNTRIGGDSALFSDRVFEILPATQVTIIGVTVQKGYASLCCGADSGYGGGIYNAGTLALTNSTVTGNHASEGGGGFFDIGTLTLTNSTVSYNYATLLGGGIYIHDGTLTLTDSTVSDNAIYYIGGAGIFNFYGTATLASSTVSGNYISGLGRYGGGITNFYGIMTLTDSTVSDNEGGDGGGIYNSGTLALTNSTVSGNMNNVRGGGIFNSGTLALTNSTVIGNYADGIYNCAPSGTCSSGLGQTQSTNSIIAANGSENCSGPFVSNGHNLSDDTTCFAASGTDLVAPAQLGPLADNGGPTLTHLPLMGSPAIDAGDNAACPATDQRGAPRPQDGDDPPDGFADCDIGAVEVGFLPEPGALLQLVTGLAFLLSVGRGRLRA